MADDVNYPHCTDCGRVHATLAAANACTHDGDEPNIVPVMAARLLGEQNENHQRLARAQQQRTAAEARVFDQLRQNGVKLDERAPERKPLIGKHGRLISWD